VNDFQRYLLHEFVEDYKDGFISRRDLIRLVLPIAGGIASAATILVAMGCGDDDDDDEAATAPAAGASPTTAATAAVASPTATGATPEASPTTGASPTTAASPTAGAAGSPTAAQGGQSPLSVPEDDPAIAAEDVTFEGNGATLMAYQATPADASDPLPLVLVCHENRGLTEHIRDVTRRFAKEGYLACAVDLLSREGGTAGVADQSQIPGILSGVEPERHVGDFQAAIDFYVEQPELADTGRVAMVGYCFGGGITWRAVTQIAELGAAAPYYGPPPPLEEVPNISAAVLGVYSSDPDDFANNGRDELEAALQAAGVTYEFTVYPDTQHAFHNDTGPRYNAEQAQIAWQDTLAWFEQHLADA
jgi:carboxymethylenebutenolidase